MNWAKLKIKSLAGKAAIAFVISECAISSFAYAQVPPVFPTPSETESTVHSKMEMSNEAGELVQSVEYQYGELDPASIDDQSALQIQSVAKSLGTEEVQVFVEEGKPLTLPQKIKSIPHKIITVPKWFAENWKASYRTPTAREWAIGLFFIVPVRVGITGAIWFSTKDIPNALVVSYLAAYGTLTGFNYIYHATTQNFYAYGLNNPGRSLFNWDRFWMICRNATFDFTTATLTNASGGFQQSTGQLGGNGVLNVSTNLPYQSQKVTLFKDRSNLNFTYNLMILPITSAIQAVEAAAKLQPIWTISFYEVRASTLATIGLYAGLIAVNHFYKEPLIRVLTVFDRYVSAAVDKSVAVFRLLQRNCKSLLKDHQDQSTLPEN